MDSDQSQQETFVWREEGYIAYGIVMFLILTVGFVGNVLTLLVLHRREHRKRSVTPLMINLAFADIFIIVFGYPVAISANFAGRILDEGSHCAWVGFINGTVGITSIITLTEMALVTYRGLKTVAISQRLSTKQVALLIFGAWLYGGLSMTPPLIGWNRFVLTSSKVSCCPDWTAGSASAISYNLLLVMVAFFIPLSVMIGCYYKICGVLRRNVVPENIDVQTRRRASLLKIVRMTAMSVLAFVLSWSPYCFVSLAAIFAGRHVMSAGEAEVPEMLAKASVVYNPIVYTAMNSSFRCTLWRLLRLHRRSIRIEVAFALKNDDCVRNGTLRHNSHQFKTVTELRVPSLVRRDTFKGIVMYNN